jgi:hypothetical protein
MERKPTEGDCARGGNLPFFELSTQFDGDIYTSRMYEGGRDFLFFASPRLVPPLQ